MVTAIIIVVLAAVVFGAYKMTKDDSKGNGNSGTGRPGGRNPDRF